MTDDKMSKPKSKLFGLDFVFMLLSTNFQLNITELPGLDFSLASWLTARSKEVSGLTIKDRNDLILKLGLQHFLLESTCSLNSTTIKDGVDVNVEGLPDEEVSCLQSPNKTEYSCCVFSSTLQRHLYLYLFMDLCHYQLKIDVEQVSLQYDLLNYEWGTQHEVTTKGVWRLKFAINNLQTEMKFTMDMSATVCLESSGPCDFTLSIANNLDIPYLDCSSIQADGSKDIFHDISYDFWKIPECTFQSTDPQPVCTDIPEGTVEEQCQYSKDCTEITCCIDFYFGEELRNMYMRFGIDSTTGHFVYELERKQWSTGTSPAEITASNKVAEALTLDVIVANDVSATAYKLTVNMSLCTGTNATDPRCYDFSIFQNQDLKKISNPVKRKRRKRSATEDDFETMLRNVLAANPTNEELQQFFGEQKAAEEHRREQVWTAEPILDSDTSSSYSVVRKSMGSNNPDALRYRKPTSHTVISVEGGDKILEMLGGVNNVAERANELFIAGEGLSKAGTELLGVQLANMTIGDIEAILHANKVDPFLIRQLFLDFIDLAKALFSEVMKSMTGNNIEDAFKSFEFTLQGTFSYPRKNIELFDYSHAFPVGGIIWVQFSFGASGFYGMEFGWQAKVLAMTAGASVVPYGGLTCYGEVGVGFPPLYGKLRLEGDIMELSFPTQAEIAFNKFPLDVSLIMDLELVPVRLKLFGLVTMEVSLFRVNIKTIIFEKLLWEYEAQTITKRMIEVSTKDEDDTPPEFGPPVAIPRGRGIRALPECEVKQLTNRDYTDPAFEITVAASDDKADVNFFLDVGTFPAGNDAANNEELGGPSTVLTTPLKTGVPLYFTVYGENSASARSSVQCFLSVYDVTVPTGRLKADFLLTSNPNVIKVNALVHDESDILYARAAVGFGEDLHGDQLSHWRETQLRSQERVIDISNDPHNTKVMEHFTEYREGKLDTNVIRSANNVLSVGVCAKQCVQTAGCSSFNYDFSDNLVCELLPSIQGFGDELSISGLFGHFERIGSGHNVEFSYDSLNMAHNMLHFVNLDLTNVLGYNNIISSNGVLTDLTCPTPGPLMNVHRDKLFKVSCESMIPENRPDLMRYCTGTSHGALNHREIEDGEGSMTIFNGDEPMTDQRYTRSTNFIAANWDGIYDNESSILTYSLSFGRNVCEDLIHLHNDPHSHLLHESHWTNMRIITATPYYNPFPLEAGQYYTTIRALNKVEYGGPFSTTICHTTPFSIDITRPFVYEVYNLKYNEDTYTISLTHNSSDPESGVLNNDICLGQTTRDCNLMGWQLYSYSETMTHVFHIPDGIPAWMRLRATNNVQLFAVGRADRAMIVDSTPPNEGSVFDGPLYGEDLAFTKDDDLMCTTWSGFYDPHSGIDSYAIGIGTEAGLTDVAALEEVNHRDYSHCASFNESSKLLHNNTYYAVVWAHNGAINQKKVSNNSNGVRVDLTPPVAGSVIDGNLPEYKDIVYSASKSTVKVQWKYSSDPESGIRNYHAKVLRKKSDETWETIQGWTQTNHRETKADWKTLHLFHKDEIKSVLRTTNQALNEVEAETNGFLVDLTPPLIKIIGDGEVIYGNTDFQTDDTFLGVNFDYHDPESQLSELKVRLLEMKHGSKHQIYPVLAGSWVNLNDVTRTTFIQDGLSLTTGHRYSVRVAATNGAGLLSAYETDGVLLDKTGPIIYHLHVGVLGGEEEILVGGYSWQSDHEGIKTSWIASDPESGSTGIQYTVGTTKGGSEVLDWTIVDEASIDAYLVCTLTDTYLDTYTPVYYVSLKVKNGAGLWSQTKTSAPIIVVPEDKSGIVTDGPMTGFENDIDYQSDTHTTTITFSGYESALHGIESFDWTIGTSSGAEDIKPYMEHGIIHEEYLDVVGGGIASFGLAQSTLELDSSKKYYTTLRAITHAGNILQATTDGFTVDITPPDLQIESLSINSPLVSDDVIFQLDESSLSALWYYNDTELNNPDIYDNIIDNWYIVGTNPYNNDLYEATYLDITKKGERAIEVGAVSPAKDGKPTILTVYAKNAAGLTSRARGPSVIHDNSAPLQGKVSCSKYVQSYSTINCEWIGFYDLESRIEKYIIIFGSKKGDSDKLPEQEIPGTQLHFATTEAQLDHTDVLFASVIAINSVGINMSAFSDSIMVDDTPPTSGVVVELFSMSRINPYNSNITVEMNRKACRSEAECEKIDSTCIETFTRLGTAWSTFTDGESNIDRYELGLGTTPGGYQLVPFFEVDKNVNFYVFDNLNLMNQRQVFVTVKAINGAGLGTSSVSNGVYLSYLSQGLPPLSHVGIWDSHPLSIGDIEFQTEETTIEAMWDVSGDPCPVEKYEWSVEETDGTVIQEFLEIASTHGYNGEVNLQQGKRYYSLLRVTNAIGYTYTLRTDGITINSFPLIPGYVFDGDVEGYDLLVIPSRSIISANWEGFGELKEHVDIQDVLTGNTGVKQNKDKDTSQEIAFYMVAVGSDRRFPKTRENIIPYTNVGTNTSVTFTDLELEPGNAVYYFTVHAFSTSLATATVTSNGFSVTFSGGVIAGEIDIPDYIYTTTYMDFKWTGFKSQLDIMLYYIAVSDHILAKDEVCKHYVDGGKAKASQHTEMFNINPVTNVGTATYTNLTGLILEQEGHYYVWVMGVDQSGECNMTFHDVHVDNTPPEAGQITSGPFFNMSLTYALFSSQLRVRWLGFTDAESSISHYNVTLFDIGPCALTSTSKTAITSVNIDDSYSDYTFKDLNLLRGKMYQVSIEAFNNATLSVVRSTAPTVFDDSLPQAGFVAEGLYFVTDVVWWGDAKYMSGTVLHHPDPSEDPCPNRTISMNDTEWSFIELSDMSDPTGFSWNLVHRPSNVLYNNYTDTITVKIARDSKATMVYSGAYMRSAEMFKGGTYEIAIKAADGEGNAVTGVTFWDGEFNDLHLYNHVEEEDWTLERCACCYFDHVPNDCPCECDEILLNDNGTIRTTPKPTAPSLKDSNVLSQQSCGIQLYSGTNPQMLTWCTFYNNAAPTMKVQSELFVDPSGDFHTYRIEFNVIKEELFDTWCMYVYMDGSQISDLCGIPNLSEKTNIVLHGWNKNNYLAGIDIFYLWEARAQFGSVVLPPSHNASCRFGLPFISGTNPIVSYEAGIGTTKKTPDVVPFTEVLVPCIPCFDSCSHVVCDRNCPKTGNHPLSFSLNDILLDSTNGTALYLIVKAILGSGASVQQSSDGYYIDLTPPTFDPEIFLYIDVRQGRFTPVEYQGSETTIKAIWLCIDDESGIKEYSWTLGTDVGLDDLQLVTSTGMNGTGTNDGLEGLLKNNKTYYVTVSCTNDANIQTTWQNVKGVTVLLVSPDPDQVKAEAVNAETFALPVSPDTALKSEDQDACGQSFEVSDDSSVKRYDFCVGSSKDLLDDIIPCIWVSYNTSGVVEIKNGHLMMDGIQYYSLAELKALSSGVFDPTVNLSSTSSVFHMEIGRTLFLYLKFCNLAVRCSTKLVNTLIIANDNTQFYSSKNGESISATINQPEKRRRRATSELTIQTPLGLSKGQSFMINTLTENEMAETYTSDASNDFISYIANPNTTLDKVDRILYGRIQNIDTFFAISPVGQAALPGPLNITYEQTKFNPAPDEETMMLIHWNPDTNIWQLTSETCNAYNQTVFDYQEDGATTILVCNTRLSSSFESTNNTNVTAYFYKETQFGLVSVLGGVINSAPNFTAPFQINITEDSDNTSYNLQAFDKEGDPVLFSLVSGMTTSIGNIFVDSFGLLQISQCAYCFGSVEVVVRLYDEPTDGEFTSASSTATIQITSSPVNNPPVISLFSDNKYSLMPDPTEHVMVYRENNHDTGMYLDIGLLIVYDVDGDTLSIDSTTFDAVGTFTLTEESVDELKSTINCSYSMCLNQSIPADTSIVSWKGLRITYNITPDYYGQEIIKLVGYDSSGTYSDVVTINVVIMINNCLNDGVCASLDPASYSCNDVTRSEGFADYYTCTCTQAWTGPYCEIDVNECTAHDPCSATETCTNTVGSYECTCDTILCKMALTDWWQFAVIIVACVVLTAGVPTGCFLGYRKYRKRKTTAQYTWERSPKPIFNTNTVYPAEGQGSVVDMTGEGVLSPSMMDAMTVFDCRIPLDGQSDWGEDVPNEADERSEDVPDEEIEPSEEVPNEAINPREVLFEEASDPSEEVYGEAMDPSEDVSNEAREPSENVPDEAIELSEVLSDEASDPSEDVPDEAMEPTEEMADEAREPSENVPDKTSEPNEDVPDEASGSSECVPDEASGSSEDVPDVSKYLQFIEVKPPRVFNFSRETGPDPLKANPRLLQKPFLYDDHAPRIFKTAHK